MLTIKVFDPPMCCSTGVCGPDPDVSLARFAADVQWLQSQGVLVSRFTLTQQPDRFAADPDVMRALNARSTEVLPIVMANDRIVSEGQYPSREELCMALGLGESGTNAAPSPSGSCCGPTGCC